MKITLTNPADAQEKQDALFRRMSADERIDFGSRLWLLAEELAGEKFTYATNRSTSRTRRRGTNSKKT